MCVGMYVGEPAKRLTARLKRNRLMSYCKYNKQIAKNMALLD